MHDIVDLYSGFEREPELAVTLAVDGIVVRAVRLWVGYFDPIMDRIPPEPSGWSGLALPYHLHTAWYERSPWALPRAELSRVLSQWNAIPMSDAEDGVVAAHAALGALFREAERAKGDVTFDYF